jgi:tape measure domain-containing protein
MSKTVDERVVEMRFDNQQFERNVQTSMSTLDKLKNSLKLSGASKGLETVSAASKSTSSMVNLGNAVETVRMKFSALDVIGVTALANITNAALNAGKNMVSALTIDPIKTGFQEYETQMNAVQTILANTQSKGSTLKDVNAALDELNKYADLTIYNFTEMTRNIGRFTAAGVDLETSVSAIQGIANLAAVSGSTSQQASTVMYQLSQALATGTVKLMDWNSVVNAGMGGEVFQNALKETSRLLGTGADAAIKAEGSFRESLSTGWLTSEVLTETLKKFTTSGANEYVAEYTGLSVKAVEAALKSAEAQYGEADAIDKASEALAKKSGKSKDEIKSALQMAKTAQDAATKVKTFSQLWDVMKEAAQSGWARTWQIIIGDFEEAKSLLTPLADFFTNIIEKISNARNKLLESGLSKGFSSLAKKITKVLEPAKKAANMATKVTGALSDLGKMANKVIRGDFGNGAERIKKLTKAGENYYKIQNEVNKKLGYSFQYTEKQIEAQDKLLGSQKDTTKSTSDNKEEVVKLTDEQKKLIKELANTSDAQLKAKGYTDEQIAAFQELRDTAEKLGLPLNDFIDNLDQINGRWLLINSFKNIGQGLVTVFKSIGKAWRDIFPATTGEQLFNIIAGFHKLTTYLKVSDENAEKFRRTFRGVFAALDIVLTIIGGPIKIAFKILKQLLGAFDLNILDVTAAVGDAVVKFHDWLESTFDLTDVFKKIAPYIKKAVSAIREFISSIKDSKYAKELAASLRELAEKTREWFASLKDSKVVKEIASYLKESGEAIKKWIDGLKDADNIPKYIFEGLVNGLKSGVSNIAKWALEIGKTILDTIKEFLGIHSPSTKMEEVGRNIIEGLINGIKNGLSTVWNTIKSVGETVINGSKDFDWGKIIAVAFGAGLLLSMKDVLTVLKNLTTPLASFSDLMNGVSSTVKNVGDALSKGIKRMTKAMSFKKIADAILEFAVAIGVLAASLYLISKIEPDRLWASVGAIAALAAIIGALAGVVMLLNKKSFKSIAGGESKSGADEAAKTVLALCAAILIIAIAIKKVASIGDPETINAAVYAINKVIIAAGAIIILFGALAKGKNTKNIDKVGEVFIKIGAAILLMAIAMKMVGKMDGGSFDQAMIATVGFSLLTAGLIAVSKLAGRHAEKAGKAMLAIGGAFVLMAYTVKMLGTMDRSALIQGSIAIIAFGGIVTGLIAATKLAGDKNVLEAGGAILMIAGALLLMAMVVKILGSMDVGALIKGTVFMAIFGGMIVGLIAATNLVGDKNVLKAGASMLMIAGALAIMALVVKLVADMEPGEIAKGVVIMAVFGLLISGLIKATGKAGANAMQAGVAMIGIAVAIGIMAAVVFMLGQMDIGALAKGLIAVAFLSAFVAGLIVATKYAQQCVGTLIVITVAVAILAAAVIALSFIDPERLTGAVVAIGVLMGIFAGVMYMSQYVEGSLGVLIVLTVAVAVIGAVLYALGTLPLENALAVTIGLSAVLISLSLACLILSTIPITGALTAVGSLAIFVAGMAAILAALGGLSRIPGFNELITDGGETLALIGYAIGKFVGSIVGGAMAGISSGLPEIGANLSAFIINATPFIVGVKMVDESALKGVGVLTAAILALTYASFIQGITALIPLAPSFADMGTQLSQFIINAMPFILGIGMINEGAANGAKSLAQMLLALTAADILQGLTSWLTGGTSLADFGAQLAPFGESIAAFAATVKNVDGASVQAAANAGKTMAEMAKVLPKSGGIWQDIVGESDMAEFGAKIVAFAVSLVAVSTILSNNEINEAAITAATNAGKKMSELADTLPKTGGIWQEIAGTKDIADFGAKIAAFAESMVTVSNKFGDMTINESAISSAVKAGGKLVALQEVLPKSGGWWEKIAGKKDISNFGEKIAAFAESMATFASKMGEIKSFGSANLAVSITRSLANISEKVDGIDEDALTNFGSKSVDFAKKLKSFADKVSEVDSSSMSSAISGVNSLITLANGIAGKDYSSLNSLAASLEKLGKVSVDKFVNSFKSAAPKASAAGKSLITGITKGATSGVSSLNNVTKNIAQKMLVSFKARQGEFGQVGKTLMAKFANGIKSGSAASSKAFSTALKNSVSNAKSYWSSFYDAGAYVAKGFASGIDANAFRGEIAARAMAKAAYDAAKAALKINSPSKIFRALAAAIPEGFAQGIYRNLGMVSDSATNMADTAINNTRDVISHIADVIQGGIDAQPTIRPVVDLSNVESGARSIGEMFNANPSVGMMANIGSINSMMNRRQNESNDDVVTAIKDLGRKISDRSGDTYNFGDFTYSDGSEVSDAIKTLVRAARIERRN